MPIADTMGYNEWQMWQEKLLFQELRRREIAGQSKEELDAWFAAKLAELAILDEDAQLRFEVDVPWWLVIWRWLRLQFTRIQYILFPPDIGGRAGVREITNPVGSIPILGQLVGFGMEIGKQLAGQPDAIIHNQYGNLPFITDGFQLAGSLVDNWKYLVVGGVVLLGLFAAGKVVSIVRIGTKVGGVVLG